ncbi:MAG: excinuclease ABC subunit UvrC [Microthrixaceae bacterium]
MVERPPAGTIPDEPGSYQFRDGDGRVIYVGKAKSLRQRLSNYFADPRSLPLRTAQMVAAAQSVEWITVRNEVEALMLEYNLIKEHRPRFNVRLVDDKSYPYLALTMGDEWPRAMVMRGRRKKPNRYFGPFAHAYAIRETLDLLLRTFPIRTCTDGKFKRYAASGRPCLLFHIEKCSGPCVGEVTREDYDQMLTELAAFLEGDTEPVLAELRGRMNEAAAELEFEAAARLRDRLANVERAVERQQMVAPGNESFDVVGLAEDELEAAAQVFHVRKGRVVGRNGFILDKALDLDTAETVAEVIEQLYAEDPVMGLPPLVVVPAEPADGDLLARWLAERRETKVEIRVPQRGGKRELLETVTRNASDTFARHRLKRGSDHNSRAKALNELQSALSLPEAPLRIECFDMSHLQGTDYVGSMVVLEDGLPKKSEYRRFKVRSVGGRYAGDSDDFAAMEEVVTRRLTAYAADRRLPLAERGKFQYPPQLLLVDGGKGQLAAAVRALEATGLDEEIPVAALAKRFEEVFVPGSDAPVEVRRGSDALFLLQRIRDESHRFAIGYHRTLRAKRSTASVLDDVAGLGPTRKKRLLAEAGGITKLRAAQPEELRAFGWLPDAVADGVWEALHGVPVPTSR